MPFEFSDKVTAKRLPLSWTKIWCLCNLNLCHHIISVTTIFFCLPMFIKNLDGDKNNPNWDSWYINENFLKSRVFSSSKLFSGICIWQDPDWFHLYFKCPQCIPIGSLTPTAVGMSYSTQQNSSSEGLHFVYNLVLSIWSIM